MHRLEVTVSGEVTVNGEDIVNGVGLGQDGVRWGWVEWDVVRLGEA